MAKNRNFSLSDTMGEAIDTIAQSKNAQEQRTEQVPVTKEEQPETMPAQSAQSDKPEKTEKRKKGRKPKPIDPVVGSRKNIRNVSMDDRTMWRMEYVKKKLNNARKEGEIYVSVDSIAYMAVLEYLEKHYPETNKLYDKAVELGFA